MFQLQSLRDKAEENCLWVWNWTCDYHYYEPKTKNDRINHKCQCSRHVLLLGLIEIWMKMNHWLDNIWNNQIWFNNQSFNQFSRNDQSQSMIHHSMNDHWSMNDHHHRGHGDWLNELQLFKSIQSSGSAILTEYTINRISGWLFSLAVYF